MAINIFLIVSGLSVAFLVYVLVQFWREGHRPKSGAEPEMVFSRRWNPNVIVVTHPISLSAYGGVSVVPLQLQDRLPENGTQQGRSHRRVLEMPAKRPPRGLRSTLRDSKLKVR
jgi:hypothetical protein